jgi:hypothetical protein
MSELLSENGVRLQRDHAYAEAELGFSPQMIPDDCLRQVLKLIGDLQMIDYGKAELLALNSAMRMTAYRAYEALHFLPRQISDFAPWVAGWRDPFWKLQLIRTKQQKALESGRDAELTDQTVTAMKRSRAHRARPG